MTLCLLKNTAAKFRCCFLQNVITSVFKLRSGNTCTNQMIRGWLIQCECVTLLNRPTDIDKDLTVSNCGVEPVQVRCRQGGGWKISCKTNLSDKPAKDSVSWCYCDDSRSVTFNLDPFLKKMFVIISCCEILFHSEEPKIVAAIRKKSISISRS